MITDLGLHLRKGRDAMKEHEPDDLEVRKRLYLSCYAWDKYIAHTPVCGNEDNANCSKIYKSLLRPASITPGVALSFFHSMYDFTDVPVISKC